MVSVLLHTLAVQAGHTRVVALLALTSNTVTEATSVLEAELHAAIVLVVLHARDRDHADCGQS